MPQAIADLFQEVIEFIGELKNALASGQVADVTRLDEKVDALCQQINNLPLEKRFGYNNELAALQEALANFEEDLRARKDAVQNELMGTNTSKKANVAYRRIDQSDQD